MNNLSKAILAGTACAATAAVAIAGTGHQWGDFLWDYTYVEGQQKQVSLDIQYRFSAESGSTWLPYYQAALGDWENNDRSPIAITDKGEYAGTTSAACDHIAGEILVCADRYGTGEGWVGIAEIDLSGNNILWATAKFNDSFYAPDSIYAGTYNTPDQRQFVACHEIGHTWGLGHLDTAFYNKNQGSCMDYTADPDGDGRRSKDNRYPGTQDWDVLNSSTMYGTESGGKKGGGGGGGRGGPPNRLDPFAFRTVDNGGAPAPAMGRFGQIVGYDDLGRPNAYVRFMPNGHERRIFVTWAKGYRPEHSL